MELTISGQRRRAVETAKPQAVKKPAKTNSGPNLARPRTDKASWSQAALAFLQETNRQDMERRRKLLEAKQKGNGELDALTEALKKMDRCQKIASRIMKGDKVPPQDEQFLMEADPDGYKLAIACRVPKERPKEWESVLEEEDREDGSAESAESGEVSAEAPESGEASAEAPESGGETAEC